MAVEISFNDSGRKATQPANPKYPNGVDVNAAPPGRKACTWNVPYPAPGVGTYSVVCKDCGYTALMSVAGRADDPRTIRIPCKGLA